MAEAGLYREATAELFDREGESMNEASSRRSYGLDKVQGFWAIIVVIFAAGGFYVYVNLYLTSKVLALEAAVSLSTTDRQTLHKEQAEQNETIATLKANIERIPGIEKMVYDMWQRRGER